jgi:hypothetical protein
LKCGPFFTGKKKMKVTQQFGVREERMYVVGFDRICQKNLTEFDVRYRFVIIDNYKDLS